MMLALDAPWTPGVLPFLCAFIVCVLVVPLSMRLAQRIGAIDHPDSDERRIHRESTPRLGGIALFAGFAAAVIVFGGGISSRWAILVCCAVVTALMAIDDTIKLPWWAKLGIQGLLGVMVSLFGITITYVAIPGFSGEHVIALGLLTLPVTVIWVMGMQNTINLLDGSDGVAAGVVAIVAAVSLIAAINRLGAQSGPQNDVIILSAALMGCCMGFLILNTAPARVFMGDSGSHFLGVAVAVITILGVAKISVALSLFVPLIALGLPLGDTALAIVRRRRAGRSIAEPDTGHLHHRLLARGLSPRETALAFYLATAILGCFSLELFGHRRIIIVGMGLLGIALALLVWRTQRRRPDPAPPEDQPAYLLFPGFTEPPGDDPDAPAVEIETARAAPARNRHGGERD